MYKGMIAIAEDAVNKLNAHTLSHGSMNVRDEKDEGETRK